MTSTVLSICELPISDLFTRNDQWKESLEIQIALQLNLKALINIYTVVYVVNYETLVSASEVFVICDLAQIGGRMPSSHAIVFAPQGWSAELERLPALTGTNCCTL